MICTFQRWYLTHSIKIIHLPTLSEAQRNFRVKLKLVFQIQYAVTQLKSSVFIFKLSLNLVSTHFSFFYFYADLTLHWELRNCIPQHWVRWIPLPRVAFFPWSLNWCKGPQGISGMHVCFLEGYCKYVHYIWSHANSLGKLHRVCNIPDASLHFITSYLHSKPLFCIITTRVLTFIFTKLTSCW